MKKFIEKIVHFFTPELPQSEQASIPENTTTLQVSDSGKFKVILVDAGENKINVIQKIREITGLGLKEGKNLSDNGGMIGENLSFEEANRIKQDLESVGATVVIE